MGGYLILPAAVALLTLAIASLLKNIATASFPDISSTGVGYTNAGWNLIGNNEGFVTIFSNGVNGTIVGVDPLLAPLANYGGTTQRHALLPGSPAINAGNKALITSGVTTDQRGPRFCQSGRWSGGHWRI